HLFHFIIRYEGAGIIDSNVVKFMKAQTEQKPSVSEPEKKENEDSDASERTVRSAIGVGCPKNVNKGKKVKEENELPAPFTATKKAADEKKEKKEKPTKETQWGKKNTEKKKNKEKKPCGPPLFESVLPTLMKEGGGPPWGGAPLCFFSFPPVPFSPLCPIP